MGQPRKSLNVVLSAKKTIIKAQAEAVLKCVLPKVEAIDDGFVDKFQQRLNEWQREVLPYLDSKHVKSESLESRLKETTKGIRRKRNPKFKEQHEQLKLLKTAIVEFAEAHNKMPYTFDADIQDWWINHLDGHELDKCICDLYFDVYQRLWSRRREDTQRTLNAVTEYKGDTYSHPQGKIEYTEPVHLRFTRESFIKVLEDVRTKGNQLASVLNQCDDIVDDRGLPLTLRRFLKAVDKSLVSMGDVQHRPLTPGKSKTRALTSVLLQLRKLLERSKHKELSSIAGLSYTFDDYSEDQQVSGKFLQLAEATLQFLGFDNPVGLVRKVVLSREWFEADQIRRIAFDVMVHLAASGTELKAHEFGVEWTLAIQKCQKAGIDLNRSNVKGDGTLRQDLQDHLHYLKNSEGMRAYIKAMAETVGDDEDRRKAFAEISAKNKKKAQSL